MLLRSPLSVDATPTIHGDGIYLRAPIGADYGPWSDLRERSRNFLAPWEPTWPADDLTRSSYKRRIKRYLREVRDDSGYAFFLFRQDDDSLMGGIRLSHVRRGVAQSCSLGYWMGECYAGRGYMTAAVRSIIPFIFDALRLHRIEAACLPHNKASMCLLEKVGFQHEGRARSYLCINGLWQDHMLFAFVESDLRQQELRGDRPETERTKAIATEI